MVVTSKWQAKAIKKWGRKAVWINGNGQYALLAWCNVLTVTLWPTMAEAENRKAFIDRTACGSHCTCNHEIVDLSLF